MELSPSQILGKQKLEDFLESREKLFTLKGSAGTGKSTIISLILNEEKYHDKKIAFSATTNKAVSILKEMCNSNDSKREVVYLTIHKLLRIQRKIDKNGNELFITNIDKENIKTKSKSIYNYDIIVVDEASMINFDIIQKIIAIKDKIKGKVIFVGDPAQLPPVNEKYSLIFKTDDIPNFELKEIMRYKGNIVDLNNKIRDLVFDDNTKIKFKNYIDEKFSLYKDFNKWINSYLNVLKEIENINNIPIFIVYTNRQCDIINSRIRQNLFKNFQNQFVQGELIIFNNYFKSGSTSYYTSKKIKVQNTEKNIYNFRNLNDELLKIVNDILDKELTKMKERMNDTDQKRFIIEKDELLLGESEEQLTINKFVNDIRKFNRKLEDIFIVYEEFDLKIWKLGLTNKDSIIVINSESKNEYEDILDSSRKELKKVKGFIDRNFKFSNDLMSIIWEYFYSKIVDIFADISYGYCITTHKSQGSTFDNIYIDMNNIITKNKNKEESYRCLYTASTRSSNKVNLLL